MPLQTCVELEWCAMVEDRTGIISGGGSPEWSLLPYAHTIDLCGVSADCAHCVSGICGYAVSKLFLPISYCYQPLAVAVPGQIIDAAGDDRIFAFRSARPRAVPDADCPRDIARGNVVT